MTAFSMPQVKKKFWSKRREKSKILRPVKGNAILFFSVHLNASSDKSSYHTRSPILDGELWVATKFFYLRPTATGNRHTVEYDRDDCTDEDKSCPRWAAIGECERNAVFMIGSPDYYGTCRKSCNACWWTTNYTSKISYLPDLSMHLFLFSQIWFIQEIWFEIGLF